MVLICVLQFKLVDNFHGYFHSLCTIILQRFVWNDLIALLQICCSSWQHNLTATLCRHTAIQPHLSGKIHQRSSAHRWLWGSFSTDGIYSGYSTTYRGHWPFVSLPNTSVNVPGGCTSVHANRNTIFTRKSDPCESSPSVLWWNKSSTSPTGTCLVFVYYTAHRVPNQISVKLLFSPTTVSLY